MFNLRGRSRGKKGSDYSIETIEVAAGEEGSIPTERTVGKPIQNLVGAIGIERMTDHPVMDNFVADTAYLDLTCSVAQGAAEHGGPGRPGIMLWKSE